MKQMDKDGLLLCTLQGNIFASSLEYTDSSSEIFMRRFMMSKLVKVFDSKAVLNDSLTIKETFEIIENEFGKTSYGKVKYHKDVLFWIGYLYRYMAYTYDLSSKFIYKIIKPKELNELYYVYHTFDCSIAIEKILEEKDISFDEEKQNERLLKLMRRKKYEKEVEIVYNLDDSHQFLKNFKDDDSPLENKEEFKEYVSFQEKIEPYQEMKINDGYKLLTIEYMENAIGEIHLIGKSSNVYELEIVLKDERYQNKEMAVVALQKCLEYARQEGIREVIVRISKTDERCIHVFKKLGFAYKNENNDLVYYAKLVS